MMIFSPCNTITSFCQNISLYCIEYLHLYICTKKEAIKVLLSKALFNCVILPTSKIEKSLTENIASA